MMAELTPLVGWTRLEGPQVEQMYRVGWTRPVGPQVGLICLVGLITQAVQRCQVELIIQAEQSPLLVEWTVGWSLRSAWALGTPTRSHVRGTTAHPRA